MHGRRGDEEPAHDEAHEGYNEEDQVERLDGCRGSADCEKAWLHSVEEINMQGWFSWLEDLKKQDEKEQMEKLHQQQASQMVESAEGSAGLLHKITKPTAWRGGAQILEKEEDAGLMGEENRIGNTQAE